MITNERQYKVTKAQTEKFEDALSNLMANAGSNNENPILLEIQQNALRGQIESMRKDLQEYEGLKSGRIKIAPVTDIGSLPSLLIKARISLGLTQADLAKKLAISEQQIQRYESENYYSASLKRLVEIGNALQIKLDGVAELGHAATSENVEWSSFPIDEMYKRGWFEYFKGSLREARANAEELLKEFFFQAELDESRLCFHRKLVRSGGTLNQFALQAWKARVLIKTQKTEVKNDFRKRLLDEEWFSSLAKLSRKDDGLNQVASYLSEAGIFFVIEPHLSGTHLDGAALLSPQGHPIVAMTLRQDRIDNFWFVLFHELAHVALHLDKDDASEIYDDDLDSESQGIEKEADEFALERQIPSKVWKTSIARYSGTKKAIEKQADLLGIHPAIIAGRIRKETGVYTNKELNDLVGSHLVRSAFSSEIYS